MAFKIKADPYGFSAEPERLEKSYGTSYTDIKVADEAAQRVAGDTELENSINTLTRTHNDHMEQVADNMQVLGSRIDAKQDTLVFDNTPIPQSQNPVTSDGVHNAVEKVYSAVDDAILDLRELINKDTPVVAHGTYTGSEATYTATIPGITELYPGLQITIVPDMDANTYLNYLNLNNLGNKVLYVPSNKNSYSDSYEYKNDSDMDYQADFIHKDFPVVMMYTGQSWRVISAQCSHVDTLVGILPVYSGGTGGETAEEARKNIGAASVDHTHNEYATENYVDNVISEQVGNISVALDNIMALQNSFIGGDSE